MTENEGSLPEPIAADVPPWEQPSAVRRDCQPHRGALLQRLGLLSTWCARFSFILIVPALVALPVGLMVTVLARRDLARMDGGLMDPAGEDQTAAALFDAQIATMLSMCPLLALGFLCLACVLGH